MADVGAIPDDPQTRIRGATQPAGIDWDRLSRAVGGPSRDALAADDAKIASLEPKAPVLTPMPPKEQPSDPLQAFGQPALWIAAIGGLLSRNHLTSAIQSAGAVMNSIHQQDQAAAQRHYDEWKINTENALKMAKYEQDAYKAALSKKNTDVRQAEAEFRTVALAARSAGPLKALDEGGLDGAASYAEAHRKGVQRIEEGASNFSAHVDAQTKIAEGLGSDDPTQQAEALDLYAAQIDQAQKGKGSTATSRMGTLTVGVRLRSIADALRSGDPEKMAAAQREASAMPELGPGVLKPPRAPDVGSPKADRAAIAAGVTRDHPEWTDDQKAVETERLFKQAEAAPRPQTTPWTILTEPSTNQQYRARTGPDGKPEYTDMAGNQIEPPKGAERISTQQHAPAPGSVSADRSAIAAGVDRDHPDWTPDKKAEETERLVKAADTAARLPAPGSPAEVMVTVEKDLRATHPDWTEAHVATEASRVAAEAKQSVISDDAAKLAADVALKTGHPPAWMGRSSGSLTKFLDAYSSEAKAQGIGASEIASNVVKFSGELAEARTLGTASARIDLSARELDVAIPQALELSERVYRPGFKKLAEIQQALQGQTSDPDLLEFAQQNQQLMSAYALSMSRGGVSTVASMDRAEHLLATATSQAGYMRQLDRLHKEVQTILYGTAAAKQGLVNEITGGTTQLPAPSLTGVQRAKPEGMTDDQILDYAKKRIKAKPEQKPDIIKLLKAWGLDTGGM